MKLIVDRCAGRRLAVWLQSHGHDVLDLAAITPDPGDVQLLALAHAQQRVLVTIDTDFGKLIYREGEPHAEVVRLPDVPAAARIQSCPICSSVMRRHS